MKRVLSLASLNAVFHIAKSGYYIAKSGYYIAKSGYYIALLLCFCLI